MANSSGDKLLAHKLSTSRRASNRDPRGLWSDGTTIGCRTGDKKLYAYKMSDKSRDGKDFDTLEAAGNEAPFGIFSDGTTMWVSDKDDAKIYAYKSGQVARRGKTSADAAGNANPRGLGSDGTVLWTPTPTPTTTASWPTTSTAWWTLLTVEDLADTLEGLEQSGFVRTVRVPCPTRNLRETNTGCCRAAKNRARSLLQFDQRPQRCVR